MSAKNLRAWLLDEYAATMSERVRRLRYVVKEYGQLQDLQVYHGGFMTLEFFEEARWCFINGHFIACVLLCQCFLENSLRSLLAGGGANYGISDKWLEDAGFYDLIEKAQEQGLIRVESAKDFHAVRKMRVEYVHARPAFSKRQFARRVVGTGQDWRSCFKQDARRAIKTIVRANQRAPFRWGK